jgi:hypothetical protein
MSTLKTFKIFGGTDEISYVPIEEIELDSVMVNTLDGVDLSSFTLKTRTALANKDGKLSRMKSMMKGMKEEAEYEPVQVVIHQSGGGMSYVPPFRRKEGKTPKKIPLKITYSVINGRHRVVASILNEYTHVPVLIQK